MKKIFFLSMVALSVALVSCQKQAAAEQDEKEAAAAAANVELKTIMTAYDLAKIGYETESASALIEAANLLVSTPAGELEVLNLEKGEAAADAQEKAEKEQVTPAKLLADAKALTEDANLLALAGQIEAKLAAQAGEGRGATQGPIVHYDRILAGARDNYTIAFRGNEFAEVGVIGDGDTDLDLYVYDENGNLIASDTDYSDRCYCSFNPIWTGNFIVRIVNRGNVYNEYCLITN